MEPIVKVRFLKDAQLGEDVYHEGDEAEIGESVATDLINELFAERVEAPEASTAEPTPETPAEAPEASQEAAPEVPPAVDPSEPEPTPTPAPVEPVAASEPAPVASAPSADSKPEVENKGTQSNWVGNHKV